MADTTDHSFAHVRSRWVDHGGGGCAIHNRSGKKAGEQDGNICEFAVSWCCVCTAALQLSSQQQRQLRLRLQLRLRQRLRVTSPGLDPGLRVRPTTRPLALGTGHKQHTAHRRQKRVPASGDWGSFRTGGRGCAATSSRQPGVELARATGSYEGASYRPVVEQPTRLKDPKPEREQNFETHYRIPQSVQG